MCAHAPAAEEITRHLTEQVYPAISQLLDAAYAKYVEHTLAVSHLSIADTLYCLKKEFDSLRNYEAKLVFPIVLRVFNTKDLPAQDQPKANIDELQRLTQNKEKLIAASVLELERCAATLNLSEGDPLAGLLHVFKTKFITGKQEWHNMLLRWKIGCACFASANDTTIPPGL